MRGGVRYSARLSLLATIVLWGAVLSSPIRRPGAGRLLRTSSGGTSRFARASPAQDPDPWRSLVALRSHTPREHDSRGRR